MKSTWFADKERFEFAKCIHDADYSHQIYDTFRGFLTCAFLSFQQAIYKMVHGELNQKWEDEVIKEQQRVKHPSKYAEALGILTMALEKKAYDFLGFFISEMDLNDSKWKGQLFTPTDLAELMAKLTLQEKGLLGLPRGLKPKPGRTLWLSEPACGGGAMVIGASEHLKSQGFYPWDYHWVAVDCDWRCYAMAYIQLTLLGIPATVVHGNSLTLEEHEQATTLVGVMHPPKQRRYNDDLEDVTIKSVQASLYEMED